MTRIKGIVATTPQSAASTFQRNVSSGLCPSNQPRHSEIGASANFEEDREDDGHFPSYDRRLPAPEGGYPPSNDSCPVAARLISTDVHR